MNIFKYVIRPYFIYFVIGITPTVLGGYLVSDWQWWASCSPLWIGVYLHGNYLLEVKP